MRAWVDSGLDHAWQDPLDYGKVCIITLDCGIVELFTHDIDPHHPGSYSLSSDQLRLGRLNRIDLAMKAPPVGGLVRG